MRYDNEFPHDFSEQDAREHFCEPATERAAVIGIIAFLVIVAVMLLAAGGAFS
jgi:hypothetical protein